MENLLQTMDPLVLGTILLPLVLTGAAWSLRMACAICSVKVPDFVPAATVVVVCIAANFALRIVLHSGHFSVNQFGEYTLMLSLTALIVAISVRTSVFSAVVVTVTQAFLFGLMYIGLSEVCQAMF